MSDLFSPLFLLQRDSWDQSAPETVSQVEPLCPDSMSSISVPPSMPSPEPPGSPSQYRAPSRCSSSIQAYTLHPLEDAHYHSLTTNSSYSVPSSFPCPPYMSSSVSDLVTKMVTDEVDGHNSLTPSEAHTSWAKEDGVSTWSPYESRRAYWLDKGPQALEEEFTGTGFVNRTFLIHSQSTTLS